MIVCDGPARVERERGSPSTMRIKRRAIGLLLVLSTLPTAASDPAPTPASEELSTVTLERGFRETVQPFLETYCLECHGKEKPKGDLNLSAYTTVDAVAKDSSQWETSWTSSRRRRCRRRRRSGSRRPALRQEVIDWIEAVRQARGDAERGRSRPGAGAAAEQRRVRLHHPRPDGRRHPADPGVPRRPRQRGRLRQLGRIAGDVAGPGEEVPGGRAVRRRPPRAQARRAWRSRRTRGRRHRPRQVLRAADHRLLQAAADRLRRLLPRRLAVPAPRGPGQARRRRWPTSPPRHGLSRKYLATIWATPDGTRRKRSARSPPLQALWRAAAAPRTTTARRTAPGRLRADARLRRRAPRAAHAGGQEPDRPRHRQRPQPFVLWKNRQYRREPDALRRRRWQSSAEPS